MQESGEGGNHTGYDSSKAGIKRENEARATQNCSSLDGEADDSAVAQRPEARGGIDAVHRETTVGRAQGQRARAGQRCEHR